MFNVAVSQELQLREMLSGYSSHGTHLRRLEGGWNLFLSHFLSAVITYFSFPFQLFSCLGQASVGGSGWFGIAAKSRLASVPSLNLC